MTSFRQGDVVLVRFVFTDESGEKRRPALILSSDDYQHSRQEVIIAAITSNVQRLLVGDQSIADWRAAGLLFPSVATGVIRTVKQSMLDRRLGSLTPTDLGAVQQELAHALGL